MHVPVHSCPRPRARHGDAQAVYSGMSAIARGTEAIERELDSVLAALHARHQPPSRPPASRKVVANLPRMVLDDAELDRIGRSACSMAAGLEAGCGV